MEYRSDKLFRFWNNITKEMYEGDYHPSEDGWYMVTGEGEVWSHPNPTDATDSDVICMMFTGIRDVLGTKIYEGDICLCRHSFWKDEGEEPCIVGFSDGMFGLIDGDGVDFCGFFTSVGDGSGMKYPPEANPRYRVVGNVYEHPGLHDNLLEKYDAALLRRKVDGL